MALEVQYSTVSMSATCPRNRLKKIFRSWMPRRMYEAPEACEVEDAPNSQGGASLSCTRPGTGVWLISCNIISEGGVQLRDCQEQRPETGEYPFVSVPQEGIVAFQGIVKRILTSHMEEGQKAGKRIWPVGWGQRGFGRVALRTCEWCFVG